MFPGLLLQQPAIPVQNAMKIAKNATINNAIAERPMSGKRTYVHVTLFNVNIKLYIIQQYNYCTNKYFINNCYPFPIC